MQEILITTISCLGITLFGLAIGFLFLKVQSSN
uniref:Subunit VII of cytochrome b6/f complex n=1 Tax=Poterioochromonas malhamensis TaxID=88167 RepID=A0A7T6Y7N8_9STRA|nr:subunit VII of cytochrome b6/f complex [Poterioochromonas malhamensis]YP_010139419.1 subunit VII of cytochrome b6/f complex [Poterioochromonas malhamensis]QQK54956.1 subunit VII of cytochrome b6/f complex [Poterioochromonas malhamensis]QQK55085.1 subunit VII of cytochrome b6/f complex [Poterioochromonas malhamensis]